jgi:Conserved hypothetical protein (DUF2461)
VVDAKKGKALSDILQKLKAYSYQIGGTVRKTVPKGFEPNHERAALLLHEGLVVMMEGKHPAEISSAKIVNYCTAHFEKMMPLNRWLKGLF